MAGQGGKLCVEQELTHPIAADGLLAHPLAQVGHDIEDGEG